jgi:cellulose biosynthesis protein BcsQ
MPDWDELRRLPIRFESGPRPFQVVTVTSNKGGVGKTTIAANLAIYLRARDEQLPILVLGLDDQSTLDRLLALEEPPPRSTIVEAFRSGCLASAVRLGRHGIHYVPSSPEAGDLKREITNPHQLRMLLGRTDWRGLVVIDTKSDLEILTRNALAASDLALVVVKDHASLAEAEKVYSILEELRLPREHARIVLSLVDRRVKYRQGGTTDVLGLLLSRIRERGHPLFQSFLSTSPKVDSLTTNPEGSALSILEGASGSLVHRQMRSLADEVAQCLRELREHTPEPAEASTPEREERSPLADWRRVLRGNEPGSI